MKRNITSVSDFNNAPFLDSALFKILLDVIMFGYRGRKSYLGDFVFGVPEQV